MSPRTTDPRPPGRGGAGSPDPAVTPLRASASRRGEPRSAGAVRGSARGAGHGDGRGERRGEARNGEARNGEARNGEARSGERRGDARAGDGRRGLGDARRYTPHGRSVRETAEGRRAGAGRGGDPFRPALQVLQGGAQAPARRASRGAAPPARTPQERPAADRRTAERTAQDRATARGARPSGARGAAATAQTKGAGRRGTADGRRPVPPTRRPALPPPVRKPRRALRLPDPRRRLRLAILLVLVLFVAIAGRLVELQLTDARAYAARGLSDRLQTVPLAAPRGTIYDRGGAVLAHSVEARYVYADPGLIDDPEATADALSPLLAVARSVLLPKLRKHTFDDGRQVRFEYLARGVDVATGEAVMALGLPGIGVRKDEKREVPGHDLASNLIGFTGPDMVGLAGLESGYDALLRGVEGERTFEIGGGRLGAEIPGGYHEETPPRPGSSLQLTIDRDLQYEVQHVLFQRMRAAKATFGTAVVLDVRTGEVLAQASYPGYDGAEPFKSPPSHRGDANTDIALDPGSVAKVITLGAALEEKVCTPESTVVVGPTIRKGDTTYTDTHRFPSGTRLTLPALMAFSSNVGTIQLASQLGADRLYDYQLKFGLGTPTGEGLPGESAGLVRPPANWSGTSYGSIPIGMGISVTPLQMAAVYAAIANDGLWVQPRLVRATVGPDGRSTPAPAPRTRQVLSAENAAAVRTILEAVVTVDGATGRAAAVPGYRVAGKTGTGLRVVDGKYTDGEVASFVGMAPADSPRYVIGVFAHTPSGGGGALAAPAFRDMMAFTLGHFQVPPPGTAPPRFVLTR